MDLPKRSSVGAKSQVSRSTLSVRDFTAFDLWSRLRELTIVIRFLIINCCQCSCKILLKTQPSYRKDYRAVVCEKLWCFSRLNVCLKNFPGELTFESSWTGLVACVIHHQESLRRNLSRKHIQSSQHIYRHSCNSL
jgi:hypothetical protein